MTSKRRKGLTASPYASGEKAPALAQEIAKMSNKKIRNLLPESNGTPQRENENIYYVPSTA